MTPAPNDAPSDAPFTKLAPAIVTLRPAAPWLPALGLAELTVGAVLTAKALAAVPTPPSRFTTVTFRTPVVALVATLTFAVSWLGLTYVVELVVTPEPNDAVAPGWNPVPVTVTFWLEAPWPRALGAVAPTVGSASTVKAPVPVAVLPSPLVIFTSRGPGVAVAATVTLAVSFVWPAYATELTVTPVPNDAVSAGPLTKFVPVIVTVWLVVPWASALGAVEVTVGGPETGLGKT